MTTKLSDMLGASDGRYLAAKSLPSSWKKVLTIHRVEVEQVGQGNDKTDNICVHFSEFPEGTGIWVLNKGARDFLVQNFSDDLDEVIGQRVELFKTTTEFQGRQVDCLRPRLPKGSAVAVPDEDESPF